MKIQTKNFKYAYDTYYKECSRNLAANTSVLEIGGGAHPSIQNRKNIIYTIVDPDHSELNKAPDDVIKLEGLVQDLDSAKKYDLIISKMVLEHVSDPDEFHDKVLQLLTPNGKAIHFFAGRHSLPALVNRLLPEFVGDNILKLLKNRDLSDSPKYEAYYKRSKGHTKSQREYFYNLGYEIESYFSFVGHKYLGSIPILGYLEQVYSRLLTNMKFKNLATVALVVLKKNR
jgi:SAM-dependent methyltransferase